MILPGPILNERLKGVLPILGLKGAAINAALLAPYLTHRPGTDSATPFTEEEASAALLLADDGIFRTPYEAFRFCIAAPSGDSVLGYAERKDGRLSFLAFHRLGGAYSSFVAACTSKPRTAEGVLLDTRIHLADGLADVTKVVLEDETAEALRKAADAAAGAERQERDLRLCARTQELAEIRRARSLTREEEREVASVLSQLRKEAEHLKGLARECERKISLMREVAHSIRANAGCVAGVPSVGRVDPATACSGYYSMLLGLCYHYLAPFNFVARVSPPAPPGKSVEWLRAREHMTVVHRRHPANSGAVGAGATIDDDRHRARIAHSRRAHTKLLTSERFRHMRGQRVFVSSAWIGPKEWRDSAGQTYAIVPRGQ